MGRLVAENVAALALEEPLIGLCSGVLRVVILGMEFVVVVRDGRPGWKFAPVARPKLLEPFLIGDRDPPLSYCGDVVLDRTSPPPIGISPDVGVGSE